MHVPLAGPIHGIVVALLMLASSATAATQGAEKPAQPVKAGYQRLEFGKNTHLWSLQEDPVVDYRGKLVMRPKYEAKTQLYILPSFHPNSPYHRGYGGVLGLTRNFGALWAWHIVELGYHYNAATNLRNQLLQITAANRQVPPPMPQIEGQLGSFVSFRPLYARQAAHSLVVLHSELYLQSGPALLLLSDRGVKRSFNVGLDVVLGALIHINKRLSIRVQFGEMMYVASKRFVAALHYEGGAVLNLGGL